MAFKKKTWKDRLVEFAGRRTLKRISGSADSQMVVDVTRNEGTVSQAGDAFSAANMNDLEQRIADEFSSINNNLGGYSFGETADGKPGYRKPGADTVIPFSKAAGTLSFRIKQSSGYAKPSGDNYPRAMVSGNYTVTINLETLTASISGSASVRCDDYIGTTNTVISGTANISTGISNIVINN